MFSSQYNLVEVGHHDDHSVDNGHDLLVRNDVARRTTS
jgi:hypothetical protein